MPKDDRAPGIKSAYELALERMEREGIERPREDAVSEATRREMDEVRRRAGGVQFLHRPSLSRDASWRTSWNTRR